MLDRSLVDGPADVEEHIMSHLTPFSFTSSLISCGKFGSPYLGKATAATRAALPIATGVCSISVCLTIVYDCQRLGFF